MAAITLHEYAKTVTDPSRRGIIETSYEDEPLYGAGIAAAIVVIVVASVFMIRRRRQMYEDFDDDEFDDDEEI